MAQVQPDSTRNKPNTTRAATSVKNDNAAIQSLYEDNEADSSQYFYQKLKRSFSRNKATRGLYKLLFREPYQNAPSKTDKTNSDPYRLYNGRYVGNITIQSLDPFGARVNDTLRQPKSWFERAANSLHARTKGFAIRRSLLFEKGDQFNSQEISNNERIIRQQSPYLSDARIFALPRTDDPDTVDILVITKDIWSVSGSVGLNGTVAGSLSIDNKNFFGFGHELYNRVSYDRRENRGWGYRGAYRIPFIGKSFISGELSYVNEWNQDHYGIRLARQFITPATKYAGGLELSRQRLFYEIRPVDTDTVIARFPYSYNLLDVWLGRSFNVGFGTPRFRERTRIILAGRITSNNFFERPVVQSDTNQLYENRFLGLFSLGISSRGYFRDVLINGFGRTEDVPNGWLFSVTGGAEKRELGNRAYAGAKFSHGQYYHNFGYLVATANVGGFVRDQHWEQGVVSLEANYFSRLFVVRALRMRQFVDLRFTKGFARFDDELVDINRNDGIRGISSFALRGTKSLVLNLETVCFTPLNILGFQIATFAYADLGLITPTDVKFFSSPVYQGYSIGFRIRNENLTFNTFEIRFGYYPNIPGNSRPFRPELSGISSPRLTDFDITEPQTVPFGDLNSYYRR